MIATAGLGQFFVGLLVGLFLGFLLGPIIRFWLTWQEWTEASREAGLTKDVLERMEAGPWRFPGEGQHSEAFSSDRQSGDPGPRGSGTGRRWQP